MAGSDKTIYYLSCGGQGALDLRAQAKVVAEVSCLSLGGITSDPTAPATLVAAGIPLAPTYPQATAFASFLAPRGAWSGLSAAPARFVGSVSAASATAGADACLH